jgi:outer membrane protein assembly factor BamB
MRIKDSFGEQVFYLGPASSTIWCTPSYDAESRTIYFGTDSNTAPRRPTKDDPRLDTPHACAAIAIDARDGKEKWVTQVNRGDIWLRGRRAYDPESGRYLDQSIGDTPKIYSIEDGNKATRVVGFGCKNGGFYVLNAADGKVIAHTPLYKGKPTMPLDPPPDPRMLTLPGPLGGLQTGCATDGKSVFTNGLDALRLGTQETSTASMSPPTAGRVVGISGDTRREHWRHERPKAPPAGASVRGLFKEVGDPVASGLAVANGVVYFTTTVSQKLIALDATSGSVLKEIDVGPVWSGPSVSRGRVYLGTGNILFSGEGAAGMFSVFPHRSTGTLFSFGLPGDDEVTKFGGGKE